MVSCRSRLKKRVLFLTLNLIVSMLQGMEGEWQQWNGTQEMEQSAGQQYSGQSPQIELARNEQIIYRPYYYYPVHHNPVQPPILNHPAPNQYSAPMQTIYYQNHPTQIIPFVFPPPPPFGYYMQYPVRYPMAPVAYDQRFYNDVETPPSINKSHVSNPSFDYEVEKLRADEKRRGRPGQFDLKPSELFNHLKDVVQKNYDIKANEWLFKLEKMRALNESTGLFSLSLGIIRFWPEIKKEVKENGETEELTPIAKGFYIFCLMMLGKDTEATGLIRPLLWNKPTYQITICPVLYKILQRMTYDHDNQVAHKTINEYKKTRQRPLSGPNRFRPAKKISKNESEEEEKPHNIVGPKKKKFLPVLRNL